MSDPGEPQKSFLVSDPPPILRTWSRVYIAVVLYLAVLIFLLWVITRLLAF